MPQHMFQSYQRKVFFRHHLLETFRNGDPEGLDALLECDNPFGHFNFRCHHNATLTEAIHAAANCNKQVIVNMYNKLLERGLDATERPLMLAYLAYAPISVELMEVLVPSKEKIKSVCQLLRNTWVAVGGCHQICAQGVTVDVDLLNMTKENMRVFRNLPTVQEYLETTETIQRARNPADIHQVKAARTRQREQQYVSRLIDEVLNT